MIPYIFILRAWTLFFVLWYVIGIPFGPGYPVHADAAGLRRPSQSPTARTRSYHMCVAWPRPEGWGRGRWGVFVRRPRPIASGPMDRVRGLGADSRRSTGGSAGCARRTLLVEAHARYRSNAQGANSQAYPAPRCRATCSGSASSERKACPHSRRGRRGVLAMSVSKPFVFAFVCQYLAPEAGRQRLGSTARGWRSTRSRRSSRARTDGRTRWSTRARSRRRASYRARPATQSGSSFTTASPASPAARSHSTTEVYDSASADERAKPEHRPPARELRPDLLRPDRGGRPLHEAVLSERDARKTSRRWAQHSPTAASTRSPATE